MPWMLSSPTGTVATEGSKGICHSEKQLPGVVEHEVAGFDFSRTPVP